MFKSIQKIIFLIIVSIGLSNAIDCIVCNSLTNPDCVKLPKKAAIEPVTCNIKQIGGGIDDDWLKDLVEFKFFEANTKDPPLACQTITMKKDNNEIVYRGCQLNYNQVCDIIKTKAKNIEDIKDFNCETCDDVDGCNKSSFLSFSVWFNLVFLIVLKLFY